MCQLATQSSNWISVSNWEAEKANWTPTAESVTYHAQKAKTDFDADLKLLGSDRLVISKDRNFWSVSFEFTNHYMRMCNAMHGFLLKLIN